MNHRARDGGRSGKAARIMGELSERDLAVLSDLARVRLLTGRQVQRLHVAERSPLTQARRSRALLQRLHELGLVVRLDRRIGGVSAGSAGFIYGLSASGQRLTHRRGPAGGTRLRRPWEPGSSFSDHVLAVAELYVQLQEAESSGMLDLLRFDAEPACWRRWTGLAGERLILKPDALVAVAVGDYERISFIEVDRATESLTVIRRKALVYGSHFDTGREQASLGVYPGTLWLVPDERRRQHVVDVLASLDPDTWQLFQVRLFSDALSGLLPSSFTDDGADHDATTNPTNA